MDPFTTVIAAIVTIGIFIPLIVQVAKYHICKDFGGLKDGIQHCTVCNKAISIKCQHPKWETIEKDDITRYDSFQDSLLNKKKVTIGKVFTLKCAICGDIQVRKYTV